MYITFDSGVMERGELKSALATLFDCLRKRRSGHFSLQFGDSYFLEALLLGFLLVRENRHDEQDLFFFVAGKLAKLIFRQVMSEGQPQWQEQVIAKKVILSVSSD